MAIFRRIKEKIEKIMKRNKGIKSAKKPLLKTNATKPVCDKKKEIAVHGIEEIIVEKAKFSTPETLGVSFPRRLREELPLSYGDNKIVLQIRDSRWVYSYWEITDQALEPVRLRIGNAFYSAKMVLRVYDVTNIIFDGTNANRFFDIEIRNEANNWYIDTAGPGRSWCVDLGLRLANGEFIMIVRSNIVSTPLDGPSWITDEEWMVPEEMFIRLYGMGFGFGKSSPIGKAWQERMKQSLFSGILSSPGITSTTSPAGIIPKEKDFWLVVNTELIVYGATEPDAKVSVQGKEINLRPDGTFTLRFALPDGKQIIPVTAVSADKAEERTITPIVTKETQ